ncbi:Signal transduction histidine kinase [Prosthecobacter debontii]|uniref:histidine kinase n=1 Tax=Prosthecobacter debontii TaxID=48467 RepID=A0A1T4XXJ9_9BACT|nr:HAMP domain-containing sensor histidine kinase [Prosthecobacter debontii]SKA94267.1 Signal transduction histidine kinase [Prosthecobacter debontii]
MFLKLWREKVPSVWRLILLLVAVVSICIATILVFVRMAVNQDMRQFHRNRISDELMQYSAIYTQSGLAGVKRVFQATPRPLSHDAMRLTTASGQIISEEMSSAAKGFIWPEQTMRSLLDKGDMDLMEVAATDREGRLYLGAIRLWDGNTLWMGRADTQSRMHLRNIEWHLWFAGLTAAMILLLPVMWFRHEVLRPILSFTRTAERMRLPGNNSRLRGQEAIPELRALASVVNIGLDQIQALTRELQTTNDFLAHELRTPLARIRGNLEHFHDETDNEAAREAAARSLEEIDRATQLVQTLLTIRAGDHAALRLHRQVTSLDELLTDLVELFVPAAEDRKLILKLVPGLSMTLNIDRELLTQAVSNLLDNALAYNRPGGQISVSWQGEGTGAIISVEDTGPGLHPDEIEIIWDRYVRGSAARPKSSGMGLGLSLVRSIAMAHGGYSGAHNREGGGAVFWIHIPGN